VTLQNAARAAARYAITGRWDEDVVESVIGYTSAATDPLLRREDILNNLVPCTTAHDELFYNHWGHDCDPTDDEDQGCGGPGAPALDCGFARGSARRAWR